MVTEFLRLLPIFDLGKFMLYNAELMTKEADSFPSVNRRTAIKLGVASVITAGAALLGSRTEVGVIEQGIKTDWGTFVPLYENHVDGLSAREIPNNIDMLFKETGEITGSPISLLSSETLFGDLFRAGVLEKMQRNGTKIVFGDVSSGVNFLLEAPLQILEGTIGYTAAYALRLKTRGALLRGGLTFLAEWMRSQASFGVALIASFALFPKTSIGRRLMDRIYGLQSDLHPEFAILFFRNALIAEKMIAIAEYQKYITGKNQRIGFDMGEGHGGLEDFLVKGPEFCVSAISSYPTEFLKAMVAMNGGVNEFCSIKIVEFPQNGQVFKRDDLRDPDKVGQIKVKSLVDKSLIEALKGKGIA